MTYVRTGSACHLCGSTSFAWGRLYGYAGLSLGFQEGGGFWKALTGSSEKVRARLCHDCGNIQLFANSFVVETES